MTVVLPVGLADSSYPARYVCVIHGSGMGADVTVLDTSPTVSVTASSACQAVFLRQPLPLSRRRPQASASRDRSIAGSSDMSMSATMRGKILGEDWTETTDGTETWTDISAGSEVWATVNTGSEVWLQQ